MKHELTRIALLPPPVGGCIADRPKPVTGP